MSMSTSVDVRKMGGMSLQAPVPLTSGMPDPVTIAKQREAYAKMLDEQLKQGVTVLEAQLKHQSDYLRAQANQQKNMFRMQLEMEIAQQEMALAQQHAEQTMALNQQAAQQKQQLESQALMLSIEYQKKRAEEDVQRKQYEMDCQQHEVQSRLTAEMHNLGVTVPSVVSPGSPMLQNTLGLTQFGLSTQQLVFKTSPYNVGSQADLSPKADMEKQATPTTQDSQEEQ